MTLLFPCWFPWSIDTTLKYALTIGVQLAFGGLLYTVVFGEMLFLVSCMALVRAHTEYFRGLVASADERFDCVTVLESSAEDATSVEKRELCAKRFDELEQKMSRNYRRLIQHYQYVHRHIQEIVRCCGFYSSNSLLMFFGGFVFFSVILLENDDQTNIIYKTKILSSQLLSYQFVVFSYFGETVIRLNDNFREAMYTTKWYERRPILKRTILIFMQLTQVPFKMSAFRMYTIKLGFLTYMLKTCFSLIQLLSRV